jgi:beta-lactamase class A
MAGAAGLAILLALTSACASKSSGKPHTGASSSAYGSPASSHNGRPAARPTPSPHSSTPKPLTRAQILARVDASVAALTAHQPAHSYSIAALNTVTGARYRSGAKSGVWTASVYKLLVLEALLLQNGGPLSGYDADEAIPMIQQSDNKAGYALFLDAGGRAGLAAAASKLGMTHTVPGVSDPTFTTSSASDCLHMLSALVDPGRLTPAARSYAIGLMRNVEADQRWGVGVDADKGTDFANKNGWLSIDNDNGPGEDDDGLWAVGSVGVITVHGQQVLMAVQTQHQPSFQDGVTLVQALARAIKPAIASH